MLGVVNLDKPVGPTSHDMVSLLRRLTGMRRIGHAGTLDPLASGVLPILVGPATRFSAELTGGAKRYDAVIRLGRRSATDDGEGPLTPADAPLPDDDAVTAALREFVGTIRQRPPDFSARKTAGRPAYRAARAGAAVALPEREVRVDGIEVLEIRRGENAVDVRIDLRCGAGTYVRSIARDAGELLGCGGFLHALRRTEAAGLSVDDAIAPAQLDELAAQGRLAEALLPVGDLLPLERLELETDAARRFVSGAAIPLGARAADPGRRAVFAGGQLLGIGAVRNGVLHPEKVIVDEAAAG